MFQHQKITVRLIDVRLNYLKMGRHHFHVLRQLLVLGVEKKSFAAALWITATMMRLLGNVVQVLD